MDAVLFSVSFDWNCSWSLVRTPSCCPPFEPSFSFPQSAPFFFLTVFPVEFAGRCKLPGARARALNRLDIFLPPFFFFFLGLVPPVDLDFSRSLALNVPLRHSGFPRPSRLSELSLSPGCDHLSQCALAEFLVGADTGAGAPHPLSDYAPTNDHGGSPLFGRPSFSSQKSSWR